MFLDLLPVLFWRGVHFLFLLFSLLFWIALVWSTCPPATQPGSLLFFITLFQLLSGSFPVTLQLFPVLFYWCLGFSRIWIWIWAYMGLWIWRTPTHHPSPVSLFLCLWVLWMFAPMSSFAPNSVTLMEESNDRTQNYLLNGHTPACVWPSPLCSSVSPQFAVFCPLTSSESGVFRVQQQQLSVSVNQNSQKSSFHQLKLNASLQCLLHLLQLNYY